MKKIKLPIGKINSKNRIINIPRTRRQATRLIALLTLISISIGGCQLVDLFKNPTESEKQTIPQSILQEYPQADLKEPDHIEIQQGGQKVTIEKGSPEFAALYEAVKENWWIKNSNYMEAPVYFAHMWLEGENITADTWLLFFIYDDEFLFTCPYMGAKEYTITGYVFNLDDESIDYALIVDGTYLNRGVLYYEVSDTLRELAQLEEGY